MTGIVCTGRRVDDDGQPAGPSHGKVAQDVSHDALRALGWRIGPADADGVHPAMCPRCAAPDPTLVRLCTDLARRRVPARPDPADTIDTDTLPGL